MSILTRQGLRSSLYSAMEFGFKAHERGLNLEEARETIGHDVEVLCKTVTNCTDEILRIDFRGRAKKISRVRLDR